MAGELDGNVVWLLALAEEMNFSRAYIPVTGSRTYLFMGKKVYMLYTDCPTKETARKAEKWNALELTWLALDRERHNLERKVREYANPSV